MKGQAVLIVLLVVAVALGFGLSIISQSVTDTEIAGHSEESARAFNAAEAGIENALGNLTIGTYNIDVGEGENLINVNYEVTGEYSLEAVYQENETATVVLGALPDTLTIEWTDRNSPQENPGNCVGVTAASGQTAASLLITVIDSSYGITREGWNACDLGDDFTYVADPGSGSYLRQKTLAVGANSLVRIRPIYNQAQIRVTGANLPIQAYDIDSRAQSPTLEAKAIQVSRTVPAVPAIFDYVLFSGTNIVK